MRAGELGGRVVVTLDGEDVAQIKDVVYADRGGQLGGFTLNGRGLLSGPSKRSLPWAGVLALGPDAVMIRDESALAQRDAMVGELAGGDGSGGDVLGSAVVTDTGTAVGTVVDVIIEVHEGRRPTAEVIGYEVSAAEALGTKGTRVLLPIPDTLAASGDNVVVPSSAVAYVSQDLAGFGAAMADFRAGLRAR